MDEGKKLRIRIRGYPSRCADAAQRLLDGGVTDIAGIDEVGPDYLTVVAGDGIDLGNPSIYERVKGQIDDILRRHWICAQFELIRLPDVDEK